MQLIRNPQLWLALARELGQRNRHLLLNQVAGSLAFTTTLALVPMFTVGSILIGYVPQVIEMKYALQEWILNTYLPGGINQPILSYIDQFSEKAKGLTLFGLAGLFVTTVLTMAVIEKAFNHIWQIKDKRPFFKRTAIYFSATVLGPLVLGVGIYLSGWLLSETQGLTEAVSMRFEVFALIIPLLLTISLFTLVYKVLPFTFVAWRDALFGALLAAIVFELMKYGFGFFVTKVPFYKTVYGTFAIVPLALIWIYVTWWVTLAGALLVANMPLIRSGLLQTEQSM
ncbi:YhjD/YihY/BrkB family envelope integrity protein [Polynucleobacter sp.]|jgi:membrane protein|uniref:YhjD/YihY/BrkB family envelope integrity protein n=1 Tax=Polynucleobacter sp. TaxID=2029855 RepID=UPI002734138F|nr:YhjD/YihY/BrkB family envelope integrity protein [Polynucleobacter sp.]MDP3121165.1 YhjD/YihY/BrkB family envelope integrity protein [Polynucleobacter sp.]